MTGTIGRWRSWMGLACSLLTLWMTPPAQGQFGGGSVSESLEGQRIPGMIDSAIGVTRRGIKIHSFASPEDFDLQTKKTRVLLVGGLDGKVQSVRAVLQGLKSFATSNESSDWREKYVLSAVPCPNPEGFELGKGVFNSAGGNPSRGYPPKGVAYSDTMNPEAIYLWRWMGMHAPDLVVDVRYGSKLRWYAPKGLDEFHSHQPQQQLPQQLEPPGDSLVRQLAIASPCETGSIPAIQVETPDGFLPELFSVLEKADFSGPSEARRQLQKRIQRSPREVAEQLSRHYGHDLKQVVYIPALALISRIRLGELTDDPSHLKDVIRICDPYHDGRQSPSLTSGSALSGHLVFCELAAHTEGKQRERYLELARAAADLAFDEKGQPRPSMPFHLEMSDSVFMGGPILARVGKLSGEPRYFDACARHLQFMRKLVLRKDGLYRHSPLDEAAWGRGNGFVALGLAMCLSDFPEDHPQRGEILTAFRQHLQALAAQQDPTGMWRQVIDREESYRELTSTCMITFAMVRGVRRGWLDKAKYQDRIDRVWRAICTRTPASGRLVDVCAGTGKQKNLRAYFDRTAILGPDARGGAMALMVATEVMVD